MNSLTLNKYLNKYLPTQLNLFADCYRIFIFACPWFPIVKSELIKNHYHARKIKCALNEIPAALINCATAIEYFPLTKAPFAPISDNFILIIVLVLSALSWSRKIQMESIVKPVLGIVRLEGRYRTISIWLRFIVYKPVRAVCDFPQPGNIESCSKIFASTIEIASGNDEATVFTQTSGGNDPPGFACTCSRTPYG